MPCEKECAPAVSLPGAGERGAGVRTRRLSGANQIGRLFSSAACRLGEKMPARLAPIGDCAQAASEAADKATASQRTRRPPAGASQGALDLVVPAPTSKRKVVPRLMGGICYVSSLPAGKNSTGQSRRYGDGTVARSFCEPSRYSDVRAFTHEVWRG